MLNGLTVLVTRPRAQADSLAREILDAGGRAIIFPTLEIISIEPEGGWQNLQNKFKAIDIIVFTSANAVREIISYQVKIPEICEVAAIGTATQQALLDAGFTCDWIPMRDFRSEGLLELPVFQEIKNKKIIIMSGEGGRDYLQAVLEERGAHVEKVAVYKRACPVGDASVLKEFLTHVGSKIIISTSVESLNNLLQLSTQVGKPFGIPLIVVSERMGLAAKALGFKTVYCAESAGDDAILNAILRTVNLGAVF